MCGSSQKSRFSNDTIQPELETLWHYSCCIDCLAVTWVETINITGESMMRSANMLNGIADETTRNKCLVSMLPSWSLNAGDKVNPLCSLADISFKGASILIPKTQDIRSELFDLVFMSPGNENEVLMILQAEQRWKEDDISDDYIRVGVEFQKVNPITSQAINAMTKIFVQKRNITQTNPPSMVPGHRMPLRVIV